MPEFMVIVASIFIAGIWFAMKTISINNEANQKAREEIKLEKEKNELMANIAAQDAQKNLEERMRLETLAREQAVVVEGDLAAEAFAAAADDEDAPVT